jgi:hypothetical protein
MRNWPVLLLLCLPAAAAEKAAYDSNGRIIAMLSDAEDVEVVSSMVAVLPSCKRIPLQVRRAGIGATRQGSTLAWPCPPRDLLGAAGDQEELCRCRGAVNPFRRVDFLGHPHEVAGPKGLPSGTA